MITSQLSMKADAKVLNMAPERRPFCYGAYLTSRPITGIYLPTRVLPNPLASPRFSANRLPCYFFNLLLHCETHVSFTCTVLLILQISIKIFEHKGELHPFCYLFRKEQMCSYFLWRHKLPLVATWKFFVTCFGQAKEHFPTFSNNELLTSCCLFLRHNIYFLSGISYFHENNSTASFGLF